ncbi:hypothetical protein KUTeg_002254 [Tegillarca granosa]|uniref:Apple domain-containing protein n=1 Tax=Tegillarca granosa TaxID=220873 RepID=A0ABQ9FXE0_TEGGR|nr:hypothetical protein KUTeg_002254 [Tegillarca granosa]
MEVKNGFILMFLIVILFCLFEVTMSLCTGVNFITSGGVRNGEKVADEPFVTYNNMSTMYSCAELCMMFPRCSSFNYNTLSGDCELNQNDTSTGTIATDADYKLSDVSFWPLTIFKKESVAIAH